jgi:AcrR family transcriptional regulator
MLFGALSASERRELAFLCERASPHETLALVERLLPEVGSALFADCRRAITVPTNALTRAAVGARLQRALAPYARRPPFRDVPLKAMRRGYWAGRRYLSPRTRRKRLAHGGLVVAISGGRDAAVRRSVVERLDTWLRHDFAVLCAVYANDPQGAAVTARRFAAHGGLVLTADHPIRRSGPRRAGVPPPDLEIVLDGEAGAGRSVAPGVVVLEEGATYETVQRVLWAWL